MPYLSWEALRENRDQHESKDAKIDELEEVIVNKDEEIASLKARIQLMMADREVVA